MRVEPHRLTKFAVVSWPALVSGQCPSGSLDARRLVTTRSPPTVIVIAILMVFAVPNLALQLLATRTLLRGDPLTCLTG